MSDDKCTCGQIKYMVALLFSPVYCIYLIKSSWIMRHREQNVIPLRKKKIDNIRKEKKGNGSILCRLCKSITR